MQSSRMDSAGTFKAARGKDTGVFQALLPRHLSRYLHILYVHIAVCIYRYRYGEVLSTHLHGEALSSKTTVTAKAKTTLLPYACVGHGLSGNRWATAWIDARREEQLECVEPFLPTFSERKGVWAKDPMSASEASIYLTEFVQSTDQFCGEFPEKDAAHLGRQVLPHGLLSRRVQATWASCGSREQIHAGV